MRKRTRNDALRGLLKAGRWTHQFRGGDRRHRDEAGFALQYDRPLPRVRPLRAADLRWYHGQAVPADIDADGCLPERDEFAVTFELPGVTTDAIERIALTAKAERQSTEHHGEVQIFERPAAHNLERLLSSMMNARRSVPIDDLTTTFLLHHHNLRSDFETQQSMALMISASGYVTTTTWVAQTLWLMLTDSWFAGRISGWPPRHRRRPRRVAAVPPVYVEYAGAICARRLEAQRCPDSARRARAWSGAPDRAPAPHKGAVGRLSA
ncbi:hypothetical protein [Actinosynnema sp. NPDC023587]|uniref:hypothetical protein n=1 Tax=Actinosynnema sp. NPDC023587 TaxID=3154695 RepID=UPI0033E66053